MDWINERYVRLYTRDTATWKVLTWQSRFVLMSMLRKVDRSGVLEVGNEGVRGLAAVIEVPIEIVDAGLPDLIDRETIVQSRGAFVMPKFLEAQECRTSDAQRKRESRERHRTSTLETNQSVDPVTRIADESHAVTRRHTESQRVTPSRTVPSRTVPSEISPTGESLDSLRSPTLSNTRGKGSRPAREPKLEPVEGFRETVALFHDRYASACDGAKPTWGAKQGAQIKRLLKAHGAAEVGRRITTLFESPPPWLRPPFDIGTLVQHFDKLSIASEQKASAGDDGAVGRQLKRIAEYERRAAEPHEYDGTRDTCALCGKSREYELHVLPHIPDHWEDEDVPWGE